MQTASGANNISKNPENHFNLIQPTRAASIWAGVMQCEHTNFNLMQSRRLLRQSRWWRHAACHISILCSHTDCDSNNAQRLHFVYNIALCALPFLMLYLWYFANISLVITSILLCLLVRSSQRFYACLRFALFFICTNYLTIACCNQSCMAFIYTLYIIILSYIPSHEQPQRNTKKYCFYR